MSKNIIICCDGTGNQFGNNNSNVVKLLNVTKKEQDQQVVYYDPGVGTDQFSGILYGARHFFVKTLGQLTGYGIHKNIREAYIFLMKNYCVGDKVFLFGFSRGAYTVRVLAGFIHMMGLLEQGCENLIPYAFDIYVKKKPDFKIAVGFKATFSRTCPIHFMGIWDTVSSVGYLGNWKTYPYTANNSSISCVRHAVAIDERRAFYNQNSLDTSIRGQDIKEVWFAGVHSDVGGSYTELDSGLSKIALQWMLNEASQKGLQIDYRRYKKYVLGDSKYYAAPNSKAKLHRSLSGWWYICEIIPRVKKDYFSDEKKYFIPWARRRTIPENALIHQTAITRMEQLKDYNPDNLPKSYQIEDALDYLCQFIMRC